MSSEERHLWAAVIAQAVKDARGEGGTTTGALPWPEYDVQAEAIAWIFGEDTGFEMACDFADTNPEAVRRAIFQPSRVQRRRRPSGGWKARRARIAATVVTDEEMQVAA